MKNLKIEIRALCSKPLFFYYFHNCFQKNLKMDIYFCPFFKIFKIVSKIKKINILTEK